MVTEPNESDAVASGGKNQQLAPIDSKRRLSLGLVEKRQADDPLVVVHRTGEVSDRQVDGPQLCRWGVDLRSSKFR